MSAASAQTDSTNAKSATKDCPSGKALGGGAIITGATAGIAIGSSGPADDDTWTATAFEAANQNSNWTLTVWVICATVA